jgi:hypothetical protein
MRRREESEMTFAKFVSKYGKFHTAVNILMVTQKPEMIATMTPEEWAEAYWQQGYHLHDGYREAMRVGLRTHDMEYFFACHPAFMHGGGSPEIDLEDYDRLIAYMQSDNCSLGHVGLIRGIFYGQCWDRYAVMQRGGDTLLNAYQQRRNKLRSTIIDRLTRDADEEELLRICESGEYGSSGGISFVPPEFYHNYPEDIARAAMEKIIAARCVRDRENPDDLTTVGHWERIMRAGYDRMPDLFEPIVLIIIARTDLSAREKIWFLRECRDIVPEGVFLCLAQEITSDLDAWSFEDLVQELAATSGQLHGVNGPSGASAFFYTVIDDMRDRCECQFAEVDEVIEQVFACALSQASSIICLQKLQRRATKREAFNKPDSVSEVRERRIFTKMLKIGFAECKQVDAFKICTAMSFHEGFGERALVRFCELPDVMGADSPLRTNALLDHITCIHADELYPHERYAWETILAETHGFDYWHAILRGNDRCYLNPNLHEQLWDTAIRSAVTDEQKRMLLDLLGGPHGQMRYHRSRKSDAVEWSAKTRLINWYISELTDMSELARFSTSKCAQQRICELAGASVS